MSLQPVDFLQSARPVPQLGRVLLAIGVLALMGAAICHQRWAAERAAAEQQAQQELEAARAVRLAVPVSAAPLPDERRWAQANRERARPWMPALRAIESATRDPVYLLGLSVDASSGNLRLEGEAPSFEHALSYVQVLPDGTGLSAAHLLSHELVTDPASGRQVVRFAVVAQWVAP